MKDHKHVKQADSPLSFDQYSYISNKLAVRDIDQGNNKGVFAIETITKGETLVVMGGVIMSMANLKQLPEAFQKRTIQVEEDLFQVSIRLDEQSDYINHSCNPNAGLSGQIALVAMTEIKVEQEVFFDYAMCDGSSFDEFPCNCETELCRGQVTGDDWQTPDLWQRYHGYFSPYLQRRIDVLQSNEV